MPRPSDCVEIVPGAFHLRRWIAPAEQRTIADRCFQLGHAGAGFYTPIVRGGHPMSVKMLCLGRHWNARTYTYENTRTDVDGRRCFPVHPMLIRTR
jgi:DNA oxidative demethylase